MPIGPDIYTLQGIGHEFEPASYNEKDQTDLPRVKSEVEQLTNMVLEAHPVLKTMQLQHMLQERLSTLISERQVSEYCASYPMSKLALAYLHVSLELGVVVMLGDTITFAEECNGRKARSAS